MPDRARSAELAALTAIAAQVNCTQDLDEILSGALETTLEVVDVDAGEIFLIDDENGEIDGSVHACRCREQLPSILDGNYMGEDLVAVGIVFAGE